MRPTYVIPLWLVYPDAPADALSETAGEHDILEACYSRLSVADLRGFCTSFESDSPLADPNHVDACERLNLDEGRVGWG